MVSEGPKHYKSRILKTKYPVDEGLEAGTTKQTGKKFLKPEKSFVKEIEKEGLE